MTAALKEWQASVEKSLAGADYDGEFTDLIPEKKK